MRKLRFVAAAVSMCSWACAGGDTPEPSGNSGAEPLPSSEHRGAAPSETVKLADDPDGEVVSGGEQDPTTEGSNTNWMPTEPWLDEARRPQARERPDPRKPAGGQQSNTEPGPAQGQPSTQPGQQGESSSSGSSSGSNDSTPSPN